MAKIRSPNYPNHNLAAALDQVQKLYTKDGRNKVSRLAIATHLGHEGLSGPALGKLGAMRAYGLIEGAGDELRVTDDAVAALMAPLGSDSRQEAVRRLALNPTIFQDIRAEFAGPVSVETLTFWLIKQGFSPSAASIAARTYRETMEFAGGIEASYDSPVPVSAKPEKGETGNEPTVQGSPKQQEVKVMPSERVAFTEELEAGNYLKLIASGDLNDFLLEALEDFVKRQRKRLETAARGVTYSGGSFAPVSGIYNVVHHGHKGPAQVIMTKGDMFPLCEDCMSDEYEVFYKIA